MSTHTVEYIRSNVESDLELNQRLYGIDCSGAIGFVLNRYIDWADSGESENGMVMWGCTIVEGLVARLNIAERVRTDFRGTRDSVLAVYHMNRLGDRDGLAQLRQYADELLERDDPADTAGAADLEFCYIEARRAWSSFVLHHTYR